MRVFEVQGISCGHCVRSITQAVQALDPAAQVRVDIPSGRVEVDSERLDDRQVVDAMAAEGYPALPQG